MRYAAGSGLPEREHTWSQFFPPSATVVGPVLVQPLMSSIPLMHTSVSCRPQKIQSPQRGSVSAGPIYVFHAADPNRYIPEDLCSPVQFGGEGAIHFATGALAWVFDILCAPHEIQTSATSRIA